MTTFGFAAYLKLASLNPKPQKTELRKRILGSAGKPYDFHRSLKLASRKLIVGGAPITELLEAAKDVALAPERKSLIAGLTKLGLWRTGISGVAATVAPKVYESPRGFFKIAVQPEFALVNGPSRVAFQLWNTKSVDLKSDAAYATLALLPELYVLDEEAPTDFGVLSLHEPRVYMLSAMEVSPLMSQRAIRAVEDRMLEIYAEYDLPPPEQPTDRPPI